MSAKPKDLLAYRDIVSRIRIEHDQYALILNELKVAYDDVGYTAAPVCKLITGESRTGKSCVVTDMLEIYLPCQSGNQILRSVVYAVAPAEATVKSLLESLLKGLGDPYWSRGTVSSMTQRLYTLLDAVQCRLIILDEFQHLCDKGQQIKLDKLADWLKVLIESRKYGLIAVGLPIAESIVHKHPQLRGRFDETLRMPLFDWQDKASCAQFRGILRQFEKALQPFQLPSLDSRDMGLRFYLASAGRIGLITKLLDRAVAEAIRAHTTNIRLEDLARAYERVIWSASHFPVPGGPFGASLESLSQRGLQDTVIAQAALEEVADHSALVQVHGQKDPPAAGDPIGKTKPRVRSVRKKSSRLDVERELGRAF